MHDLNVLFFQFLWDSKRSKVSKSVVCKPCEDGGMNMLDVFKFLSAMKILWLRKISSEEFSRKTFLLSIYPDLGNLRIYGSEYANILMVKIKNPFWKDVVKHYKKLYHRCCPLNIDEFMSECIHYNVNITRDKKIVYIKDWIDNGIVLIRQLLGPHGEYLNFNDLTNQFPHIKMNFLVYEGIITAIKKYQKKVNVELSVKFSCLDTKVWTIIQRGNKAVQTALDKSEAVPAAVNKWNKIYNSPLNWKKIFTKTRKTTLDTQLRWFQLRILHRILPTNKYLCMCRIVESACCSFCKQEEETISHLFWHCDIVQVFWAKLKTALNESCENCVEPIFTETLVLFGVKENVVTDRVIDLIIILAKYYIFKCKLQGSTPIAKIFIKSLKQRYIVEKYASLVCNRNHSFNLEWLPYLKLTQAD